MTLFVLDAAKFLESISITMLRAFLCCSVVLLFNDLLPELSQRSSETRGRSLTVISHARLVAHKLLDCCYCNVGCVAIIR